MGTSGQANTKAYASSHSGRQPSRPTIVNTTAPASPYAAAARAKIPWARRACPRAPASKAGRTVTAASRTVIDGPGSATAEDAGP